MVHSGYVSWAKWRTKSEWLCYRYSICKCWKCVFDFRLGWIIVGKKSGARFIWTNSKRAFMGDTYSAFFYWKKKKKKRWRVRHTRRKCFPFYVHCKTSLTWKKIFWRSSIWCHKYLLWFVERKTEASLFALSRGVLTHMKTNYKLLYTALSWEMGRMEIVLNHVK